MKKALVVFATRTGSTREIAEAIARRLEQLGWQAVTANARDVKTAAGFDLVVAGTAGRMGRIYPEIVRFARRHAREFGNAKTAFFYSGGFMSSDTPENRQKAMGALAPLLQVLQPDLTGLFGGIWDPARLTGIWKFTLGKSKSPEMAPADHRDWQAIDAWADEVAALAGKG